MDEGKADCRGKEIRHLLARISATVSDFESISDTTHLTDTEEMRIGPGEGGLVSLQILHFSVWAGGGGWTTRCEDMRTEKKMGIATMGRITISDGMFHGPSKGETGRVIATSATVGTTRLRGM